VNAAPVSLLNTALPLALLAVLALLLPLGLVRRQTRSHVEVLVGLWAAAGLLLLAGAGVFAAVYAIEGGRVGAAFADAPLAAGWFFLKLSGYAALVWGPVLALVWLGLAQRVERYKGADRARDDE
jgi:hypothetical protein